MWSESSVEERVVRVLIVDDQAPFRMAARLVVDETDGFEVVGEAETGEESVDLARDLDPDLVLMDVNLPGMDGFDATRRIVANSDRVRVVVVSTYERDAFGSRVEESGASGYIPKAHFSPDALTEAWQVAQVS